MYCRVSGEVQKLCDMAVGKTLINFEGEWFRYLLAVSSGALSGMLENFV